MEDVRGKMEDVASENILTFSPPVLMIEGLIDRMIEWEKGNKLKN
jgi:hypothetical protein